MVRLIRESFAAVEPHAEEVARLFYGMLFAIAPATRELFAANMEVQRSRLLRALVYVVQITASSGSSRSTTTRWVTP
jgi:hemoglobin-like flavoprotein